MKNITDITITIFVLPILLVIIPIIYLFILVSDGYPAIYKQERVGKNGKIFTLYKFRTMDHSSDENIHEEHYKNLTKAQTVEPSLTPGNPIRIENDDRITKIGQFLRKTSLDEFPQFFNVLIGDMSIVGPRPHMLLHTEEYSALIKKYMVRQLVKPGITGVAQVRGYRGETKELHDMEGRVRLDVWYIENWSLSLDINIIFQTVWNVFKGDKNAF